MGVTPLTFRRAVFLDRDGVLNRAVVRDGRPFPPAAPEDVELLDGAVEGCVALHAAGFLLIVVSNQPDVARGTQRRDTVEAINAVLTARLPLDDIRICYHDDRDVCRCRKPAPGLLLDAAEAWGIALDRSFMIGDRWRDIEAGRRAGCMTILIDYDYGEDLSVLPDVRVGSFADAAAWILRRAGAPAGEGRP